MHIPPTSMHVEAKDNLQELLLSFHRVGLGSKPRLSGLVMRALFGCIFAWAIHHDKGHLQKEEFIWA